MKIERITPGMAEAWLEKSIGNRPTKRRNVAKMVHSILQGEWQINGVPIIFDKNGALIDGHNRLTAIIQAGKAVSSYVVRGVAPESFYTIDIASSPRNMSDILYLEGYHDTNNLAAAASLLYSYKKSVMAGLKYVRDRIEDPLSTQDFLNFVAANPELIECIKESSRNYHNVGRASYPATPATMAVARYILKDEPAGKDYMEMLETGENLTAKNPATAIRRKMMSMKLSDVRTSRGHLLALVLHGWQVYKRGEKIQRLSYKYGSHRLAVA